MHNADSALLTDLYQLTMLEGYFHSHLKDTASFELFVYQLPAHRNFLIAAGLEQAIDYLQSFGLTEEERSWLRETGRFSPAFIDHLAHLRFTGDVHALPEGTVFFANEPIIRVTAPISEAQVVETRLINILQFETMIASKAIRSTLSAPDKLLVDFGLRRAHGAEAGLLAARASYIAGFTGTSNVLASKLFGMPMYGTMAHSFVMAHEKETDAFANFAAAQPDNLVLLIDTYDVEEAARTVVRLAPALADRGVKIKAVRIDSGDLIVLSNRVRAILDSGGLLETGIFVSGDLDEYMLHRVRAAQAPIDGFGVGSKVITSHDAPYLNCAYKLQEYAGIPRRKLSAGKHTWPGRKQVFRQYRADGSMAHDVLTVAGDQQAGEPLLEPVLQGGRRMHPPEPLAVLRDRVKSQVAQLPAELRNITAPAEYSVTISPSLRALADQVDRRLRQHP